MLLIRVMRLPFLITTVTALALTSLGCKSEEVRPDPTRLRTDYSDLAGLIDIIDDAVSEIRRNLRLGDFDIVYRHALNVKAYAERLRDFQPSGRPFNEVQRYDRYVASIDAWADIGANHARLRRAIDLDKAAVELQGYIKIMRRYLGPLREDEGRRYEERIDPDPLTLRREGDTR